MIEFSGTYFQFPTSEALSVLVQFDGAELHIWHAPEPLFRIAACDSFRVSGKKGEDHRSITLPNGARIETDDTIAEKLANHFGETDILDHRFWQRFPWIVILLTGITILFGIWVISHADMVIPPG